MQMLSPDAATIARDKIRPLRRVEYDRLAAEGYFHDERVELVFGMVVEMAPIDAEHNESVMRTYRAIDRRVAGRADVRCQCSFAASDHSEPEPDVCVVPNGDYWHRHPDRALLVVEVARTSLAWDRDTKAVLYAASQVDEYWIVNHAEGVVEVHRDRADGKWGSVTSHYRGEMIAMLALPDVEIPVADILPPG
jgi:Uma2 family endonuclease